MTMKLYKKKVSRSFGGDLLMILFLALFGLLMMFPMLYVTLSSFKPYHELWIFPPRLFPASPTLENYSQLFAAMSDSFIPLSRYFVNSLLVTVVGTIGHILVASMCAYPLSQYRFPGSKLIFGLIVTSLMFSSTVTAIPSYMVMNKIGLIDSMFALILPAVGASLGLFLMKQFMDQMIHPSILESASIDGAGEMTKFFRIVMPMVKPAWLTLAMFSVQGLWGISSTTYIYSESKKTLPYALSQIAAGGIARTGVASAISVLSFLLPLLFFIVSQSNIVETMATSGMKD